MIELKNIIKGFGGKVVLDELSLEMNPFETLCVLGKSGCGKSTLLKLMAGLEIADNGTFLINKRNVFEVVPELRGVVYMSQEPHLFPHLNVFENIAFGLRVRKVEEKEIQLKVSDLAEALGLGDKLKSKPHELSGGQKQRVNFGRTLIIEPSLILLDEPFGSLDAQTRGEMQLLFKEVKSQKKMTTIFVTHDLKEALLMGDRIGRLENGKLSIFENREAFLNSNDEDIQQELLFWKQMINRGSDI